jgi:hypothetical protein
MNVNFYYFKTHHAFILFSLFVLLEIIMGTKTDLTPLMIACQNNNPEEIKLLLAKKVRTNA